jgi:hypothetical protein
MRTGESRGRIEALATGMTRRSGGRAIAYGSAVNEEGGKRGRRWRGGGDPKNHQRGNRPSVKKPPCPEGAKQVSPGQSDAAQPRSAALGKRPTPPRPSPWRGETNTRQTRHKREKPSGEMIRMPISRGTWPIRFARRKPANRGHPFTSGSQWFVITSGTGLVVPLRGDGSWEAFFTQGGASRLGRDALPWANLSLPLRGVKTFEPLRVAAKSSPGAVGAIRTRDIVTPPLRIKAGSDAFAPRPGGLRRSAKWRLTPLR